jgi:twinkle protein
MVAQKLRYANKDFKLRGSLDTAGLFGQQLWKPGGKRLVITEGEVDALSYAQATGLSWPVVSIPTGAQGAVKAIKKSLEFVESFDEVVFMYDNDEHGERAAKACAELLPPGKAKLARMALKDANEMLKAGLVKELKVAVYDAQPFRPDGIVKGADLDISLLKTATPRGLSIPYEGLDEKLRGLRQRELWMLCAGSGIGKTTLARELGYHLTSQHGVSVGYVMLEESLAKTAQSLVALDRNIPVGDLMENPSVLTDSEWDESFERVVAPSYMYDAWGSCEIDNIIAKMRYLAVGCDCQFIILDHVSMVVSALDVDERKALDVLMTRLRADIVEATGAGVIAVSHLKRNGSKDSFNEGGQVSVTDLRGSAAIEQLSDAIIAAERNQQSESNDALTTFRILKNRPFGRVGVAGHAEYDFTTGRLNPTTIEPVQAPAPQDLADSTFTF